MITSLAKYYMEQTCFPVRRIELINSKTKEINTNSVWLL